MGLYKVVGPLHKIRPKVGDGLIQDTGLIQGSLQYIAVLCAVDTRAEVHKAKVAAIQIGGTQPRGRIG